MRGLVRLMLMATMLVGVGASLSACGNTWQGVKEDTGENLEKTGKTIEKAGEAVTP